MKSKSQPSIMSYALKLLGRREQTAGELILKLKRRGFGDEEIAAVMEKLQETGLQDDTRFARKWLAYCRENKPMGRVRLVGELVRRGVDASFAKELVGREYPREEESALLYGLALSQVHKKDPQGFAEALAKTGPFLARRGFAGEDIAAALRQAVAARDKELSSD